MGMEHRKKTNIDMGTGNEEDGDGDEVMNLFFSQFAFASHSLIEEEEEAESGGGSCSC